MMNKMSNCDIKARELDMLLLLDRICQENNLIYSLSCGTLIGAVRHQGFIPWDDDIDVHMPRPDYLKLLQIFDEPGYKIISSEDFTYEYPYAKILDLSTHVKSNLSQLDKHLWIDIFPVDGVSSDDAEVKHNYKLAKCYQTMLALIDTKDIHSKMFAGVFIKKYILKPLARLYGRRRWLEKLERLGKQIPYESAQYVAAVTGCEYIHNGPMKKSDFEKTVRMPFEGHMFSVMSCWDMYLTGAYGDYMKLPPENERITHEMCVYLDE